jgi:hypothetical protein
MTRESIYAAVFAFWQSLTIGGTPAFKTATRKAQAWDGVAPEDTPALLQMQVSEEAVYRKGLPTIWKLKVKLLVYVHTGAQNDPALIPSIIFNPLVDAVVDALVIDDPINNACTLGGIVSHCAVEGVVEIFEGDLGDTAVVVIPLTILTSP